MASQSSRLAVNVSTLQRARRIPNEEWEIWREELVKLFIEEDLPRKAIVTIMAEKHQFVITEVQLKSRFKKWDVKKYIPDDDLKIMLSLKRKRQSAGKDARFQYKGHNVEQERIERAWKRQRGPLLSPDFVPSYITMYTSRQPSPQDALHSPSLNSPGLHALALQNIGMPLLEQYQMRGSRTVLPYNPFAFDFDFNFDTPQAVRTPDDDSVINSGRSSGDLVMAVDPVISPLQSQGINFSGDAIPSPEMQVEHSVIGRAPRNDGSRPRLSTTQPSRASSTQVSSIDWRRYLNFSPSMRSPSRVSAMDFRSPHYPSRPLSAIRSRTTASPRAVFPENLFQATHRERGSHSMTPRQSNRRATFLTFDGTDPDIIMLPLQMLRSSYMEFLKLDQSDRSIWESWISRGSTLDDLYSALHSEWLSLEMEEVICQGYELSAKAIRRRQAARPVSGNGSRRLLSLDDHETGRLETGHQPRENRDPKTLLKMKPTSRTWRQTSMGILSLELSTPPRDSPPFDTSVVPYVINISFIPRTQQRTTGISAVFQRDSSASQVCHISPRLRTFNVIPDDSQIIMCIRRNDMLGVQRLFSEGKASPLDVDSRGFSLLSYTIRHKNSDLFRLLLDGGAGTQNCDSSRNTIDIIWTIWSEFVEDIINLDVRPNRVDYDVGMSMTRLALKHGCDIEETISFNDSIANALSDVNYWAWSLVHPMLPIETLGFLLDIGYDLEQQSRNGLTPLLFAATQHAPHIVKCLRLFIERGANKHATDIEGQGVLHRALAAPHIYNDWSGTLDRYFRDNSNDPTEGADLTALIIFNTEDDRHEEDYDDEVFDLGPEDGAANEHSVDYVFCEDEDGIVKTIRNPMQILKKRTRFKLLTLLQLGCDPNVVDHEGLSPSDYAMEDGLWPQWHWALLNAGYTHDTQNGWVKSSLLD